MFSWLKKMIFKDTPQQVHNLRDLLVSDPLKFLMKVASDENRGRNNPVDIKKSALEFITSTDDDLAYFAIDATAVRMQMPEAYHAIVMRLEKDNSVEVLYSMTSGIGVLGRRNLIGKNEATSALKDIKHLLLSKADNSNAITNCDDFIAELAEKGRDSCQAI